MNKHSYSSLCTVICIRIRDLLYRYSPNSHNARPVNCEGFMVEQTNPLIWEAVSPIAMSVDMKMQLRHLSSGM